MTPLHRAALAAAVVAVLIRLPFTMDRMWDHDSVQFALGVEKYDLAAHHPHPPGYPLWIGVLKVLAALGIDPLHGMVGLAILGGAIGAGWMVLLAGRLAPEEARLRTGLLAAALYAFDPLLWFYGELPLIYALEGGLTVVLAWAAMRMEEGRRPFLLACGLFALAGGLRQSTMVLLAPLLLFGIWRTWRRGRLTPGLFFGGAGLGAAIVLAWLIPLCVAAGGYGAYRRISSEHFAVLLPQTSILYGAGWGALAHNVEVLTKWALQGIVPGIVALLVLWIVTPGRIVPGLRALASRLPWLLVWAGPPVLFFALFHVTKAGYTLIHLPALLMAIALAAAPALAAGRGRAVLATVLAIAVGAGLFLFGQDRRPDQPRLWAILRHEHNRGTLDGFERDLDRTARNDPPLPARGDRAGDRGALRHGAVRRRRLPLSLAPPSPVVPARVSGPPARPGGRLCAGGGGARAVRPRGAPDRGPRLDPPDRLRPVRAHGGAPAAGPGPDRADGRGLLCADRSVPGRAAGGIAGARSPAGSGSPREAHSSV